MTYQPPLPFRHLEIYQRQTIQPGTWNWLQWEHAGAAQRLVAQGDGFETEDAARRDAKEKLGMEAE